MELLGTFASWNSVRCVGTLVMGCLLLGGGATAFYFVARAFKTRTISNFFSRRSVDVYLEYNPGRFVASMIAWTLFGAMFATFGVSTIVAVPPLLLLSVPSLLGPCIAVYLLVTRRQATIETGIPALVERVVASDEHESRAMVDALMDGPVKRLLAPAAGRPRELDRYRDVVDRRELVAMLDAIEQRERRVLSFRAAPAAAAAIAPCIWLWAGVPGEARGPTIAALVFVTIGVLALLLRLRQARYIGRVATAIRTRL